MAKKGRGSRRLRRGWRLSEKRPGPFYVEDFDDESGTYHRPDISRCVGDHAEPVPPIEIALLPLGHDYVRDEHRGLEQRPLCADCIDKLIDEHTGHDHGLIFTSLEWLPEDSDL